MGRLIEGRFAGHFEFHLRAAVRDLHDFEDTLFSTTGNVVFADFKAVQDFAHRLNAKRPPHQQIDPADLSAAAMMDEVLHHAIARYRATVEPDVMERVYSELDSELGSPSLDDMLLKFVTLFPNSDVYRSRSSPKEYLNAATGAVPNRIITLEELFVNRLSNDNPAYQPFHELIGDDELRTEPAYEHMVAAFSRPAKRPLGGQPSSKSLFAFLREPVVRSPYSLVDQLTFVRDTWKFELTSYLADRLTLSLGLLAEKQHAAALKGFGGGGGPGPVHVPTFKGEPEIENFSPDVDWMPSVIMVAKNALVWLDQLTKRHGRPISRLDEIPEDEIAQLARWGFNALWLIGVWQRSEASQTLKRWSGNPDAAPSAYSLFDYAIAPELGGEEAVARFGDLCRRHGIRLASDMVPNHTGIDSKWVREHPEWFIQVPHPPYPAYRYTSESLGSSDGPVIQVEDGYFDRSDAAVTFKWKDRRTGRERFLYHGNDGTGMPWNDTAQLDFARADVREAVIQTILYVARLFPIIRFDAAMVLTKKHFHRLWYPEPGSGDGVPSRAIHGMRRAAFDKKMPEEFWREVVDRVAQEVPDTLLLAEAFWLLEGYFVRTLGMHRVYNSAFMHMLKKEDNAEYRDVMKKTIAFEPEILKRYVNFMSNPDEETAIEQFGDGDKFFGVCLLMVTLPGLPMFAHGQVEGLREKYGMEYRRAYLDETPRDDLIARFERDIVPITRLRHLFAEARNFHLFDFMADSGTVNENVFAFTNRVGSERALVLYNNRYENASGRVRIEAVDADQMRPPLSLSEALDLYPGPREVVTCRDAVADLEYVYSGKDFVTQGIPVRLSGYGYRVLTDFSNVGEDGDLLTLARRLRGAGVPSLTRALEEQQVRPVVDALATVVYAAMAGREKPEGLDVDEEAVGRSGLTLEEFDAVVDTVDVESRNLASLADLGTAHPWNRSSRYRKALELVSRSLSESPTRSLLISHLLNEALAEIDVVVRSTTIEGVIERLGLVRPEEASVPVKMASCLKALDPVSGAKKPPISRFAQLASVDDVEDALGVHEFGGTVYFKKERFETLAAAAFCEGARYEMNAGTKKTARRVADHFDAYRRLDRLMEESKYDWTSLQGMLSRIGRKKKRSKNRRK